MTSAEAQAFLAKRDRYRVLRALLGYATNDVLEVVARNYDPHNAAWIWSFRRVGDGHAADLTELADDHVPLLAAIDTYLAPV